MSDRDTLGGFALGLFIGGLAAGVTALLLAPQSGEETRTLIKDKSIELRDIAQVKTEEAIARAEAFANEALARVEEVAAQLGKEKKSETATGEDVEAQIPGS